MNGHLRALAARLVVLLALAAPVTLHAQPAQPGAGAGAPQQQDPQALLQEMEQIQQELLQAQQAVIADNPDLREQAGTLEKTMLEAMRTEGFEPMRTLNRIEQLDRQLQSEGADPGQRQDLVAEMREEQQRLMMAEQAALQHQEVQQARDEFMDSLLQAMREQNPRTDELMTSLKQKNAQLQEIVTAGAGRQQ